MQFIAFNHRCRGIRGILSKTLRIMQLTTALLLGICLQAAATGIAQTITFSGKDIPMEKVFTVIKQQTGYFVSYKSGQLRKAKPVTIQGDNMPLEQFLNEVFRNQQLDYSIEENTIFIKWKKEIYQIIPLESVLVTPHPPADISLSGRVTNDQQEPLEGVSVAVKGTQNGTTTNADGRFLLSVPSANNVELVFSFVGFETHTVKVGTQAVFNIILKAVVAGLDDVVVVGYGTQKKTSLTAAVSTLKGNELIAIPTTNLSNNLGGRVAGIISKQGSGEPGVDGSNIYIRGISTIGANQPLLVVDGVPRNFQNLDPNSIESFTILKDAAAVAPYGVAGANGVILVTTKEGRKGDPKIIYNGYAGFQNPTKVPDFVNGYQYALLKNLAAENVGLPKPWSDEALQKFKDGSDPDRYPPYYDLWGDIMTKNALLTTHSLGVSGGTDVFNYYFNLGFQNQKGMWPSTYSRRYNFNLGIDGDITPTTNLSVKVIGINKFSTYPPTDVDGSMSSSTTRVFELIKYAHPDFGPLIFSNGMYGAPAAAAIFNSGHRDMNSTSVFSQISLNQKIPFIEGLKLTGRIAFDPTFGSHKNWSIPEHMASIDVTQVPYVITDGFLGKTKPALTESRNESIQLTYQAGLNYENHFGKHGINFTSVFEAIKRKASSLGASRRNYSLYIDEISMGSSSNVDMTTDGSSSEASQVGVVYRLSYDYSDKYLLEFSGRYDGHYYFASGKRFGFFPAFSLGWRLSEEKFIKDRLLWLNNLKVRASYGEVGALAGGPFQYLSTYGVSGPGYVIGGSGVQIVYERAEPNPNITWERARKTDVGVEATLWNGLLNIEADYFYEKRSNMLIAPNVVTPLEYGIGLSQVNSAIMENKGFELFLSSQYRLNKNVSFSLSGTLTYAKNKVLQIYESATTYNNANRRRTGRPLGTQFGYKTIGYFQSSDFDQGGTLKAGIPTQPWGKIFPGDLRYQDTNGDGKITPEDHVPIGDPSNPGIIYGFSPSIRYKGFSIDILFQGVRNTSYYFEGSAMWPFYNGRSAYIQNFDYWKPDNANAAFPRLTPVPNDNNVQFSSKWMYNVSYLRLKSVKFSYDFPSKLINRVKLNRAQIYLSGENMLTWSGSYVSNFYDPESVSGGGYNYPQQKILSVGLQLTF